MNNFAFSFLFHSVANIQYLMSRAVDMQSIPMSSLRLRCGSNPQLRDGRPTGISTPVCPTSSTPLRSLIRRKASIAKGYSHWLGLPFKNLFRVSIASCLLNKNSQTQSTTGFQPDLKYFTKK